ncbi:MAG: hypothetical protein AUG49_13945 [Catenulispora sp. 13_1_20CM_3_70_7]|nr:MAG: hypothetical protein AUG49_13945 [Catenulispora sp. 13_1_20CM_3_70_7]
MSTALEQATPWLALDLVQLREGDVIIARRGGKYVHGRGDTDHLLIETSSNVDLVGDLRLTPEDEQDLRARGWLPPVAGVPGWFREFAWPVSGASALTAAHMMIDIIRHLPAPGVEPLEVVAFNLKSNEPLNLESVRRLRGA